MRHTSRSIGRSVAALAAALLLAACAMSFDARALGVTASMASPASQPVVGDTFAVRASAIHAFWGLYPVRVPSLQSALAGQLADGGSVANLRIYVRRRWSDLLVTGITLGVVNSTSITYQGVIVPAAR